MSVAVAVASVRYTQTPHGPALAMPPTNLDQPAGPRHNTSTPAHHSHPNMNPSAPPFRPVSASPDYGEQHIGNQQPCLDYAAQAYYHQWAQYYAYMGYPPQMLPYYSASPAFAQQHQASFSHHPQETANEQLQATFDSLIQRLRAKNGATNSTVRTSDAKPNDLVQSVDGYGPTKQEKKKKKKERKEKQDKYGFLDRVDARQSARVRVNKPYRVPDEPRAMTAKERRKDLKIFLPAPPPTPLYLSQAAEQPSTLDVPGQMLVILDLNGTLIYRPYRDAKSMIARPFLKPFLRYLFSNFNVMVWSSARPHNVDSLVGQCLDKELRSRLVAEWARDSFGLSSEHYNLNVQVYKNLDLVWNSDIQQKHACYATGQRFGQHNTVLIDDSFLKANAQPHNLLEIPEFKASDTDAKQDVLREVAGYLEVLRMQADVSKFIHKEPFKFDGRWQYDWPSEAPDGQGGKLETKASLDGADDESVSIA